MVVRISKGCSSAEVEASVAARAEVGWCGERRHLRGREREAEGEVVRARGAAPADRALERAVLLQHGEGGARGDPRGRAALHVLVFEWGRCRSRSALPILTNWDGHARRVRKPSLFAPQTSVQLVRPLVFEPLLHHGACRLHECSRHPNNEHQRNHADLQQRTYVRLAFPRGRRLPRGLVPAGGASLVIR